VSVTRRGLHALGFALERLGQRLWISITASPNAPAPTAKLEAAG
jgi:hypothetical protein